jgi:hypothetical protein
VEEQARRILAPHFARVTVQIEKDLDNMGHFLTLAGGQQP